MLVLHKDKEEKTACAQRTTTTLGQEPRSTGLFGQIFPHQPCLALWKCSRAKCRKYFGGHLDSKTLARKDALLWLVLNDIHLSLLPLAGTTTKSFSKKGTMMLWPRIAVFAGGSRFSIRKAPTRRWISLPTQLARVTTPSRAPQALYRSASSFASQSTPQGDAPPIASISKGKEKAPGPTASPAKLTPEAQAWARLGINANLSRQIATAFPHIHAPTIAQDAVLQAMQKSCDIILRAHTGTGKSFGILLGLLNMPRLFVTLAAGEQRKHATSSIVVVPSRELALQYELWARQLFPSHMHSRLNKIISARYRSKDVTLDRHLDVLVKDAPHVVVITASLLAELLQVPAGAAKLGVSTLRTLVLDEADALLDLPDRFPSKKQVWNHMKHPPPGLSALNAIMTQRATCSGGASIAGSGLERLSGPRFTNPLSEAARRNAHLGSEEMQARQSGKLNSKAAALAAPLARISSGRPLQLIVASATANSVLRHFLGARTGWLRTGIRSETDDEMGKWIDITGRSKGINKADEVQSLWKKIGENNEAREYLQLPRELRHSCLVVDESVEGEGGALVVRDLDTTVASGSQIYGQDTNEERPDAGRGARIAKTNAKNLLDPNERHIVAPTMSRDGPVDTTLLMTLAQVFATRGVKRGVAFIPPSWSIFKAREFLEQLEVPMTDLADASAMDTTPDKEMLFLMHATSARGLDIPGGVSHVFNVGIDAVRDTKLYTHLAGRAARIGQHVHEQSVNMEESQLSDDVSKASATGTETAETSSSNDVVASPSHLRAPGDVITLIRGLSTKEVRHNMRRKRLLRSSSLSSDKNIGGTAATSSESAAELEAFTETPNSSTPIPAMRMIVASSELKMARIYRHLSLGLRRALPRAPRSRSPKTTQDMTTSPKSTLNSVEEPSREVDTQNAINDDEQKSDEEASSESGLVLGASQEHTKEAI